MTLIEITVVILVLLTLISVLFIGANIYKKGADRAACILNIRNIHQAVRADQNLTNKTAAAPDATPAVLGDTLVEADIFGAGKYIEVKPTCPASGTYTMSTVYPATGVAAAVCGGNGDGVGTGDHFPEDVSGW